MEVNCLVKYFAIAEALVQVLVVPSGVMKVMGWLGGVRVLFPDRDLIRVQKPRILFQREVEVTVVLHLDLAFSVVWRVISWLKTGMAGSDGSWVLMASLSVINAWISGVSEGSKSFLYPAGIVVLAALSSILLKLLIAWAAEIGGGRVINCCSDREVKEVQSARWKLV